MNSLVFLLVKSARNTVLELRRKPAKLLLWVLVLAGMGMLLLGALFAPPGETGSLDIVWLKGILFLFILLFVVMAIQKGLASGNVIFDMNDVNLLFVSPVNTRSILLYGVVRMSKTAFLAGFFILFQSNSLSSVFGTGFDALLLVLLGFILAVGWLQILTLLIYSLTNGRPGRKIAVRILAVTAFLPLLVYIVVQLAGTADLLIAMENSLRSPFVDWMPVAGWASAGTVSFISGAMGSGLLFYALLVLSGALLIFYIAWSNPDYYEDVLVATETAFERKRGLTEGQINPEATSARKVKVVNTGIGGVGASAIFYKHLRESFRANRLGLWGISSIVMVLGAALFAWFLRGESEGLLPLLQILMWIQIFKIGTGRGLRELYVHYIYLIPASSLHKILWSNLEMVFKVLVESLAIFGVAGLIIGEPFEIVVAAIGVYTLFSYLLLGINLLFMRWTGADISSGLLIFIYTIAVMVIMLPGLIAAIAIGSMIEGAGMLIGLGALALWELLAAIGCFALSQGVLHNSDMPVLRTGK